MPIPEPIARHSYSASGLNLATTAGTLPRIGYRAAAGGLLFVDTLTGGATYTITWYVAFTPGGTLVPAADTSGNALTTTVSAGKAYEIPGALYGAEEISPVLNNGTGTARASLKS